MAQSKMLADCRHPETVTYLTGLSAEIAAKHPPVIREYEGGVVAYWLDGDRVVWRETTIDELPILLEFLESLRSPSHDLDRLVSDVQSRFATLLPQVSRELSKPGADMDSIEDALRDSSLQTGLVGLTSVLETVDKGLEAPTCDQCGKRLVRHHRSAKTFLTKMGKAKVRRTYFRCPDCGKGYYLLDRMIGAEGESYTAGGASILAKAASVTSYEKAAQLIGDLAGVKVSVSSLQRYAKAIGKMAEHFERRVVEAEARSAGPVHLAIDGTGVPMQPSELQGVKGKQADGSARTAEAKVAAIYTAVRQDPKTGDPKTDTGSALVSAAIDSAAAVGGVSSRSDFAARLRRLLDRKDLCDAEEVVVVSDGAPWIRNVCEELLSGQRVTYVLDYWHAVEYAGAALKALRLTEAERDRQMKTIKAALKDGRVREVIAWLVPYRGKDRAVATCIDYYQKNQDRMRYDVYLKRGIQIGSGFIESLGRQLVGERFKKPGSRWSKVGANRILAIKSCLYNNHWADFLHWKANLTVTP